MTDPRRTPFSGQVAHTSLRGRISAPSFSDGQIKRVKAPLADLLRHPDGPRDRQLLRGAQVRVLDQRDQMAYLQTCADGYCGWLRADALGPEQDMTHFVTARATHIYSAPDLKSREMGALSLNVQLAITDHQTGFLRASCGGWVPEQHLELCSKPALDPVSIAQKLLGTPYLWGGNSSAGVDCSGLVQIALQACGKCCPGDSDLQLAAFAAMAVHATPPQRGDLLFWPGHVAWVSASDMLLHANANSMSVAYEPLKAARARIEQNSPLSAHIRLP